MSDKKSVELSISKLNWLRAAVLGANDGIVSTASLVFGVAGATTSRSQILTAGLAGLVAGAFSMAVGEYVSVSSQRDAERAYIIRTKRLLKDSPNLELESLAGAYEEKGLTKKTALQVAKELTKKDPIKAHLEVEMNIDEDDLVNPSHAGIASMLSFSAGALVPLISVWATSEQNRLPVTFAAVVLSLILTGYMSATVGGASRRRAAIRVVVGGIIAMIVTYAVGSLFGAQI